MFLRNAASPRRNRQGSQVPGAGLEPAWAFAREILSLLWLPLSPSRRRRPRADGGGKINGSAGAVQLWKCESAECESRVDLARSRLPHELPPPSSASRRRRRLSATEAFVL